jgi:hypothetical protein
MRSKGQRKGYLQLNDIEGQYKDKVPQKESLGERVDEDDELFTLLLGCYLEVVAFTIKQPDHLFFQLAIEFIKL